MTIRSIYSPPQTWLKSSKAADGRASRRACCVSAPPRPVWFFSDRRQCDFLLNARRLRGKQKRKERCIRSHVNLQMVRQAVWLIEKFSNRTSSEGIIQFLPDLLSDVFTNFSHYYCFFLKFLASIMFCFVLCLNFALTFFSPLISFFGFLLAVPERGQAPFQCLTPSTRHPPLPLSVSCSCNSLPVCLLR